MFRILYEWLAAMQNSLKQKRALTIRKKRFNSHMHDCGTPTWQTGCHVKNTFHFEGVILFSVLFCAQRLQCHLKGIYIHYEKKYQGP